MPFLPYRAKNPPERFPYLTLTLIGINLAVFGVTSEGFLTVREGIVSDFALSHATFSALRLLTSMFLHGSLVHLAANMLALWLFGAALEGRLRPPWFFVLYMAAGLAGSLLHEVTVGMAHPDQFALGASGAIMGVMGAYLVVFPYSTICVAYFALVRIGVLETQARWLVLFYIAQDVLGGVITRGADGVGHFAHLGGFGAGLLIALLLRPRRDTEEVSNVQAHRAEARDYSQLSLGELRVLMRQRLPESRLVLTYCQKAQGYGGPGYVAWCRDAVAQYADALVDGTDPCQLADVLLWIPPEAGGMPLSHYLRLGTRLESLSSNEQASRIYYRVYEMAPQAPDAETALVRLAGLLVRAFGNREQARLYYAEALRRFPLGPLAPEARRALASLDGPAAV